MISVEVLASFRATGMVVCICRTPPGALDVREARSMSTLVRGPYIALRLEVDEVPCLRSTLDVLPEPMESLNSSSRDVSVGERRL